jgi:hypothetical protein
MLRVTDCVGDSVRLAISEPTEWKHIGNQIDAAPIFAQADFVNVGRLNDCGRVRFDMASKAERTDERPGPVNVGTASFH